MEKSGKIQHSLDIATSDNLFWYTGLYLGLPRVFMSIVRKRIVQCPVVSSVLIPLYKIHDPVTNREISINITDRYFFVGTTEEILSESDIGIQSNLGTITLMRNGPIDRPSKISPHEIKQVIYNHVTQRRNTIQEHVTVSITSGTFKNWEGVVTQKPESSPDHVRVNFVSNEYEYDTEVPVVLCKPAY